MFYRVGVIPHKSVLVLVGAPELSLEHFLFAECKHAGCKPSSLPSKRFRKCLMSRPLYGDKHTAAPCTVRNQFSRLKTDEHQPLSIPLTSRTGKWYPFRTHIVRVVPNTCVHQAQVSFRPLVAPSGMASARLKTAKITLPASSAPTPGRSGPPLS